MNFKRMFAAVVALSGVLPVYSQQLPLTVESPDGSIIVTVSAEDGTPCYSVAIASGSGRPTTFIEPSPLGVISDIADFGCGMSLTGCERREVSKDYYQSRIKRSHIEYRANELRTSWANGDGDAIDIVFRVDNDNAAFRYEIPRQHGGERGSILISGERSGFRFPDGTTTFITPQSDAMVGWKRTKPSYEEFYEADAPMNRPSQYGHGYTFPALFHLGDKGWVLLGETGVDSRYAGTHLGDCNDGLYTIAFPMPEENNGNGTATVGMSLPAETPWRTITLGRTLAPIVETTVTWDLVEPLYEATVEPQATRGTWSWIIWQDDSINFDDLKEYVDLAAAMGYETTLVDSGWDVTLGREGVEKLVEYARGKGVQVLLWYSSSGWWNDIVQSPTDIMSRSITRKPWMRWMKETGVPAIKVDFFGGDKQETMRLYEDILSDANDCGIAVIFHGCTMPRGWERMYPNYAGSEAVLASENLVFSQWFCDMEAYNASLHPFIRNSLGSMEYGGTALNKRFHRSNAAGTYRRTTDTFQIATAVLFQNAMQNFALAPNNLDDAPQQALDFMREVPTAWDDTRYIDGYPGRYVVVARRHGDKWYIAGVNALKEPLALTLDLSGILDKGTAVLLNDDKHGEITRTELKIKNPAAVKVTVQPSGGFVLR